jgi:heme/copper-type cytochrome/quinol oxidase subunit 2
MISWRVAGAALLLAGCAGSQKYPPLPSGLDADTVPKQTIEMTAERYHFTPEELHIKAGTLVTLKITALDGTHGIAISDFGIDATLPERQVTEVQFYLPSRGEFDFACSHLCGIGHFWMGGRIIVE